MDNNNAPDPRGSGSGQRISPFSCRVSRIDDARAPSTALPIGPIRGGGPAVTAKRAQLKPRRL